ncbi:MAG: amidohydrolase family protein [Betaproteobacteria bacterium]
MAATVFTGARVFDGSEAFEGEVRVEGNRIAQVARDAACRRAPGDTVIDGKGRTLMPGLVEPHSHLSFPNVFSRELTGIPVEEQMMMTVRNARIALDSGYTSMMSMASAKPRLDVALKKEIEAGHCAGPRYLACSTELTVTGGLGDTNQTHLAWNRDTVFSTIVDGADDMRRTCRMFAREGVDVFKLHLSGDLGVTSSAAPDHTPMTDAEVAAAAEVAKASNIRIAAHARSAESVRMALRHGIRLVNHANYADEPALDALEAAKDDVFVIPAAGLDYRIANANGEWGVSAQRSENFKRELEATVGAVAQMRKRGIRVVPGGDYGFPYTPHGMYAFDLWVFTECFGYTPSEALSGATKMAGEVFRPGGEIGQVREGALADLLLVEGDPLKDVRILQDHAKLRVIMKDGVLHKGGA